MTTEDKINSYNHLENIILPTNDISTDSSNYNLLNCNKLNFLSGMSNFYTKVYLSNEQLQQIKEQIKNDIDTGNSVKKQW